MGMCALARRSASYGTRSGRCCTTRWSAPSSSTAPRSWGCPACARWRQSRRWQRMSNVDQVERLLAPPSTPIQPRLLVRWLLNGRPARLLLRGLHAGGAILAFLSFWELAPRLELVEPAFLPPLSTVLSSGWELVLNGQLGSHVQASLSRSIVGFLLAICHAVPLGLAIGWYRRFASVVNPLLEALRNTAALALLPVFILVLGIGESSKIALVVYSCSWPILLNTITAVRNVDPLLIKSARTMGLSPLQLFRKVILPASIPTIFVG